MTDMDDPKIDHEIKNQTEIIIDFTNQYPEVKIELKKNQTLIDSRKPIAEMNKNKTHFKNVIKIYIDAFSRNEFKLKFKKVFAWLEEFYDLDGVNNSTNPADEEFKSYQFFKYHSLDFYTYANMIPGYFGKAKWAHGVDYFLWFYKEKGYITGQSSNLCGKENWDLEPAFKYLNYTNYDHEFNPFSCDPSLTDPLIPYDIFKGAYSATRKCMYGKDSGDWQIDYAKQFFTTYKDERKFYRMMFNDAHEGTYEVIKYMDEPVLDFVKFLKREGHLEDSVLMFMSDHGNSMFGPVYLLQPPDYRKEIYLGALFFLIPRNHTNFDEFDTNLKSNENIMVTPYHIHSTLLNFIDKNRTFENYGLSLFTEEPDDKSYGCNYYKLSSWGCKCEDRGDAN